MDAYIEKIKREGLAKVIASSGLDQGDYALDLLNTLDSLVRDDGEEALAHYADVIAGFLTLKPVDGGIFGTTGSHLVRVGKLLPLLNHPEYTFRTQRVLLAAAHNVDITHQANIAWIYGEQLAKLLKHCYAIELDHFDQSDWRGLVGRKLHPEHWDMLEALYDFDTTPLTEFLCIIDGAQNALISGNVTPTHTYDFPNELT